MAAHGTQLWKVAVKNWDEHLSSGIEICHLWWTSVIWDGHLSSVGLGWKLCNTTALGSPRNVASSALDGRQNFL